MICWPSSKATSSFSHSTAASGILGGNDDGKNAPRVRVFMCPGEFRVGSVYRLDLRMHPWSTKNSSATRCGGIFSQNFGGKTLPKTIMVAEDKTTCKRVIESTELNEFSTDGRRWQSSKPSIEYSTSLIRCSAWSMTRRETCLSRANPMNRQLS